MIHSPQSRPAVIVPWIWSFGTDRRTDTLCENSDHYLPGLWSASWINWVSAADTKQRQLENIFLIIWLLSFSSHWPAHIELWYIRQEDMATNRKVIWETRSYKVNILRFLIKSQGIFVPLGSIRGHYLYTWWPSVSS